MDVHQQFKNSGFEEYSKKGPVVDYYNEDAKIIVHYNTESLECIVRPSTFVSELMIDDVM